METVQHQPQVPFGGRCDSADVVSAAFKRPVFKLRRKSSQLGPVEEEGTSVVTSNFDPSPLSWRVLEKDTQKEITLVFSEEGIQLVYDGNDDSNVDIDWGDVVSADASAVDQTFTFVLRITSKKKACLDTYAHKSYYTPKCEVIRKAFSDFLGYYSTH